MFIGMFNWGNISRFGKMIKNKLLTSIAIFFFILSGILYFGYKQEISKQEFVPKNVFEVGQGFEVKESELNPELYQGPPWPKPKKPNNIFGYFLEYLRDRKTIGKNNLGPLYFASKRVVVLEQLQEDSIIGNYQNFEQLTEWWESRKPKSWQFWNANKLDNWEAGLMELYLNMDQEIGLANLITNDIKGVEKFCELRRALMIFEDKLSKKIDNLAGSEEQKEYLLSIKNQVFSRLAEKITSQIPPYDSLNHYFNLQFLSKESDGIYDVSLINLGLNQGQANFKLGKFVKSFIVGEEKIISLGRIDFSEGSQWATLRLADSSLSDQGKTPISVKIKLKKISSFILEKPTEEKTASQIFNIRKYYLFLSIITFLFSIYLGNKVLRYKKIFLKIFNAIGGFYRKRKILTILVYLGIIFFILLFTVNYFDLCLIVTVLLWMILSNEEKLGSQYSFIISLGIILLEPFLIVSKKETTTEMVSITAFMFMAAGVIQQFVYLEKEPSGKIDISQIYSNRKIRYLLFLILLVLIFLVLKSLKGELAFYRYFFESNYMSEFINRIFIKVLFLPVLLVLLALIKVVNRLFPEFIKGSLEKILFFLFSLILILFVNKILFVNEREKFASKPYITRINKTEAGLEIYGHNFHDAPFVGKVYLNGTEIPIEDWKDWRIIIGLNNLTKNGELYMTNLYYGYEETWFSSNKIVFSN